MLNKSKTTKKLEKHLSLLAKRLELKSLSEALYFPMYYELETVRACNANCRMCTVSEWDKKRVYMDNKLFEKIVREMADYAHWIKSVCLSRNGEPLLDKTLPQKVRLLKDSGIKHVIFATNAELLDENKSESLLNSGLDEISFSIDGATKKTFEYIRRGLNFEKVVKNCLRLIEMRNKMNAKTRVRIRMVLQKENYNEEKDFKKFWLSKVAPSDMVYSKAMHNWGNQLVNYEKKNRNYLDIPCISPWSTLDVLSDGKVPLCGRDYNNKILMGDINSSTLKEIWQSGKYKSVRDIHSSGKRNDISLCIDCSVWDTDEVKIYE